MSSGVSVSYSFSRLLEFEEDRDCSTGQFRWSNTTGLTSLVVVCIIGAITFFGIALFHQIMQIDK